MKLPRFVRRAVDRSMQVPLETWLRAACMLTLVALALMIWSLFDPRLIPIIIGMSLAQVFGTIAFGMYTVVVFRDLTRKRRERRQSMREIIPPPAKKDTPS